MAVMPEAEAMGELEPSRSSTPSVLTWDHVQIRAAPSNKSTLLTTVIDGPSAVPASLFRLRPPPVESNPQETHEDCDLTELRPKDELEDDDDYQEASTNLAKAIALEIQDDFEQFEGNSPSEEATTGLANSSVVQPARVFPVNHLPVRLMAKARWLPRRLLAKRVAAVRRREARPPPPEAPLYMLVPRRPAHAWHAGFSTASSRVARWLLDGFSKGNL